MPPFPPTIFSDDHRQIRSVEGAELTTPPHDIPEPGCAECGHGATAHTLMGRGTCHGEGRPSWRDLVKDSGRSASACPCVRFAFPKER